MFWRPYRRFTVCVHYSGLHPYLVENGRRRRDYPDFEQTVQIEARGYDHAVKLIMDEYPVGPNKWWSKSISWIMPS